MRKSSKTNIEHKIHYFVTEKDFCLNKKLLDEKLITRNDAPKLFHQITKVLRLQKEDEICFLPSNKELFQNKKYVCKIEFVEKKQLKVTIIGIETIHDPLKLELGLAMALPNKSGKLEKILTHTTELGVTDFYLFAGDYSNFKPKLNIARLENIVREAVEQSERARVPQITIYHNMDEYLKNKSRQCMVAVTKEKKLSNILNIKINKASDFMIGPEGGFSPREMKLINSSNLQKYSLGSQILRCETASILSIGIASLKLQ